ncbi:MAG TPA: P-loop NTPase [Pirellulaceae bacterium]|nr:P-loop NTPase [Pirellulaceae bacterium]
MIDQATELRKLVLRALREQPFSTGPPPRVIVLTGGTRGVGVTTIAVNLAVAMAEQGSRVVLVDADIHSSDVALLCGMKDYQPRAASSEARRDIHEVLHRGPGGIQIVPGPRAPGGDERSPHTLFVGDISDERFQRQILTLGRHADIVILDLGSGNGELLRRYSATADEVLLVTTPANAAVMDAYARIKTDLALAAERSLRLVVNLSTDELPGAEVHRRIDGSCRKFLDTTIELAGHIPRDEAAIRGATRSIPFVLGEPFSAASQAIGRLASNLAFAPRRARTA